MKRGGPEHPKTKRLSAILKIPKYQAVGILESVFNFTALYAKRGDIGKWTNAEIAAAIEWQGDPDALINALADARWLDRCTKHRLLVHDWEHHCDQTAERSDEVRKQGFAKLFTAESTPMLGDASIQLAKTIPPKPSPEPSPEPSPKPSPKSSPESSPVAGATKLEKSASPIPVVDESAIPPDRKWCRRFSDTINLDRDEADAFYDHHTARGWVLSGGKKMVDWKAAMRTWKRLGKKFSGEHLDDGWRPLRGKAAIEHSQAMDRAFMEKDPAGYVHRELSATQRDKGTVPRWWARRWNITQAKLDEYGVTLGDESTETFDPEKHPSYPPEAA